jgi:hypothetical protein
MLSWYAYIVGQLRKSQTQDTKKEPILSGGAESALIVRPL